MVRRHLNRVPYSERGDSDASEVKPGAYAEEARELRRRRRAREEAEEEAQLHNGHPLRRGLHRFVQQRLLAPWLAKRERQHIAPLQPGDVIRDFPFFTQTAEVQFFSTHPTLCEDVFGAAHGDRLSFFAGAWAGRCATVIGARGGLLWVLLDGEDVARVLPIPPPSSSYHSAHTAATAAGAVSSLGTAEPIANVWDHLCAVYGMERVGVDEQQAQNPTDSRHDADSDNQNQKKKKSRSEQASLIGLSPQRLSEAVAAAERLYTPEQRAFLQRAPDLFACLVDDDEAVRVSGADSGEGEDANAEPDEVIMVSVKERGASDPSQNAASTYRSTESDPDVATAPSSSSALASSNSAAMSASAGWRAVLPAGLSARMAAAGYTSMYDAVARAPQTSQKLVVLAPRVVSSTGAVGWAGEAVVLAEGGGVHQFQASLSSSIVV